MVESKRVPGPLIDLSSLMSPIEGESWRIEYKPGWDAYSEESAIRTIAAFANDYLNANGGYIVVGVEENAGLPSLPPKGLEGVDLDERIRGACSRIRPEYLPMMEPREFQGRRVLVIFAPAGETPPYRAPGRDKDPAYWVRVNSETVEAKGATLERLIEKSSRIPFDDRRNFEWPLDEISPTLVRKHLSDVRSDFASDGLVPADDQLYRRLGLVAKVNSHEVPRNIALLFFSERPEKYFRGATIEIAQFHDDAGGDLIEEKHVRGPLSSQIHEALRYLESMTSVMVRKVPGVAQAERSVAFPYEAMEEALVNAIYHRSYDPGTVEPTKIYLYPDRLEIISYPGPVPGITKDAFSGDRPAPPTPARNRRIGEFLKELRLAEGRGTGVPKIRRQMRQNGSPTPEFDFGDDWFRVTLPAHPQYRVVHSLRESARLWAIGQRPEALERVEAAAADYPGSGALTGQTIDYANALGEWDRAKAAFERFESAEPKSEAAIPWLRFADGLIARGAVQEARQVLDRAPAQDTTDESLDLAILRKRAGDFAGAHLLFEASRTGQSRNAKFLHEFAQVKMQISGEFRKKRDEANRKRILAEAEALLRDAIELSQDQVRRAWCYVDLAKVLDWSGAPTGVVEEAYHAALAIRPDPSIEERFRLWKAGRRKR